MNELHDLIEKTINPPGMLKKNRRALFLTIRDIALLVKKDALTAFNAHFPYLADSKKLQEHGNALLIPHLLHDTETEYRERIKKRWRSQTLGDTKETYKFHAESVARVRAAKIIRTPRGPGSADVIIASVTGLPTPELLAGVEAALYDHELMGFDVQVKAPSVASVSVVIEFSGEADKADVALIAEGYVHALGIGGRFALKDVYALYEPLGLATIEIISPSRDVQAGEAAVIIATITVNKAGQ
jgi:hypothetical protein